MASLSRTSLLALLSTGLLVTAACGGTGVDSPTPTDEATSRTGVALTADIVTDADVDAFRFTVTRVACDGEGDFEPLTATETADLEDMSLPAFVDGVPVADGSDHPFADQFFLLPAGCYDVTAEPLTDGEPSGECTAATMDDVRVNDGETTEIVLVSQCEGEETGGLDVIAGVNTQPTIIGLEYNPSKFVYACEQVEICATATDPDGDPLLITWQQRTDGSFQPIDPISESLEQDNGTATSCVTIAREDAGAYELLATAWDLTEDGETMEAWLQDNGYGPGAWSRDTLIFPLYVTDQMAPLCIDPETEELVSLPGARDIELADDCEPANADYPVCEE